MIRPRLFDSEPTVAQLAIVGFWLLNLGLVMVLWATTRQFVGGLAALSGAFGMLFGLLATYFALTQFMLMGRITWIERHFGLDHLASYHRLNGYLAIIFILMHPIFITLSYALSSDISIWQQSVDLILHYDYVWLALISELLFIAVVISSIYIVRRRLKFETWYFVHWAVYLAIAIVPFHQIAIGGSFVAGHPLAKAYWLGLYAFVALNVIIWRFGMPALNLLRFRFRVERVVAETPTTTSVYIRGRGLQHWRSLPGQFVLVRIFAKGLWWQEHPFSLSWMVHDDCLRLTIRHVGDYTSAIARLRPGKWVLVSGPFGRFTRQVAQADKRLFIAGGVGITPIRALLEEAVAAKHDSVLLYANKMPDDVVFQAELAQMAGSQMRIVNIYSDVPATFRGEQGYVDGARIERLVPDFAERDIYVCGPPPMMEDVLRDLGNTQIPPGHVHYERFALHN